MAEFDEPRSRNEAILQAIINGTEYTPEPRTLSRIEQLLLEILDGNIADKETDISGSTPEIEAESNNRYICGEVATINFTPCASGSCELIFTSGSTPTVLTLPNTVMFPEWFDASALEANRIYDIIITDGIYGAGISYPTT